MVKPEKILEDITRKADETARLYHNPYDNCLLCDAADIRHNEVAKLIGKWFPDFAKDLDAKFPVVLCKLEKGKYIPNPLARPGWCPRVK